MKTDLGSLSAEITERASELGLVIMSARVTPATEGPDVDLGPEDIAASDFMDIAHAVGVRLFYIVAEVFDHHGFAATLPEGDEEGQSAKRRRLLRDARRHEGEIFEIELAFAHQGVLHRWGVAADWHDNLLGEAQGLRGAHSTDHDAMDREARDALVQRLAAELAAMPSFRRRASTEAGARAAAYDHPEMVALFNQADPDGTASSVLYDARAKVAVELERLYEGIRDQLPQLAAELADDGDYRAATRVTVRRTRADDFLAARYDGYRPPAWFRELLLDTPPLRGGRVVPSTATLY